MVGPFLSPHHEPSTNRERKAAVRSLTQPRAAQPGIFDDRDFFLSQLNATATVDQRDLESLALQLLDHDRIRAAWGRAEEMFRIMGGRYGANAPDEALIGIDEKMREWTYHYLLLALNYDPNYPKVLGHGYGPPHSWLGMDVPGCRGLGTAENPDNHYSFIPVNVEARLEVHGKIQEPQIEDVNFHITSNHSQAHNVCGLNWREIQVADDGTFVVTMDRDPADGRPNHLQLTNDSKRLFIRDSRKNWDQRPNAYRVLRINAPTAAPLSTDEQIEMAFRTIIDDVPFNFWFRMMVGYLAPNTIKGPEVTSNFGGMPTQLALRGRVDLEDDEAFVVTLGSEGSDYWVFTLYDWWLMSGRYWNHTSSLNNHQAVANDDGSHTLVISKQDPGVHNWIDTEGLNHTMFLQRWQLLPMTGVQDGRPSQTSRVVKISDLEGVLPPETTWVTANARRDQLAHRLESFNRRHQI
jgi:hypothetical protein